MTKTDSSSRQSPCQPGKITWPVLPTRNLWPASCSPLVKGSMSPSRKRSGRISLGAQSHQHHGSPLDATVGHGLRRKSLTYVLLNPFDNDLAFEHQQPGLGLSLTHTFHEQLRSNAARDDGRARRLFAHRARSHLPRVAHRKPPLRDSAPETR